MGMAPEDDPKVMVYVAVERPQLDELEIGSEPVALIFNTIMQRSLDYLNIAPTVDEVKKKLKQDIKWMNLKECLLKKQGHTRRTKYAGNRSWLRFKRARATATEGSGVT